MILLGSREKRQREIIQVLRCNLPRYEAGILEEAHIHKIFNSADLPPLVALVIENIDSTYIIYQNICQEVKIIKIPPP